MDAALIRRALRGDIQALSDIGRSLPLPVRFAAKRLAYAYDPLARRRHRRASHYTDPIPPLRLRSRAGHGLSLRAYIEGGRDAAAAVIQTAEDHGHPPGAWRHVLDFGCGSGRVLIPLRAKTPAQVALYGCDVDRESIEWVSTVTCRG